MNMILQTANLADAVTLREPIMEERINGQTRLARAIALIYDRIVDSARIMAQNDNARAADLMEVIEDDLEVLTEMIARMDGDARDLRIAFYEEAGVA